MKNMFELPKCHYCPHNANQHNCSPVCIP